MSEDNLGARFTYFVVGLSVGMLVGLMFAPQAGEDTRKYLSQKAEEGRQFAQRKARELREKAEDLIDQGKDIVDRQRGSLGAAIEAGKEAYQREKGKSS